MATFDEMMVRFLFDTSDLERGSKQATATVEKTATDVAAAAEKGEKAQTGALSLIVKGWNAMAAVQRKTADAAVQNSKSMVAATDSVANSTEKVLRSVGALLLLFAGAHSLKAFTTDMIGLDAAVGRAAQNMGQTPEALSGIGRAAERMGGTFTGAVGGLQGLSDAFEQMRTTGNSAIMEPLARLQGLSGKSITFGKDVHANLLSIADALHAVKDPAMADYLGRQILGDQGLVDLARRGGGAGIQEAERQSPKITRQQTEDAQKLQAQLAAVRQNFEQIGNAILMDFGPAMIDGLKWVKDLIGANKELIETKVKEWVGDVAAWFRDHKEDVASFGKAVGDLAVMAAGLATAFASQSPAMQAMEAFAVLMGGRVLGAIGLVRGAMMALGAVPAPAWALAALGISAAAVSVNSAKAMSSADPAANDLDVDPQTGIAMKVAPGMGNQMTQGNAAPASSGDQRNWWQRIMPKILGGQDDPKVKDGIADTAKATGEMRDLMKAQRDGVAAAAMGGVTANGGAPNLRYGRGSGGERRATPGTEGGAPLGHGAKGGSFKGGGANAAMAKEAYDFWRGKGLDHNAALSMVAQEQGESGFNVRSRGDYVNGNPTAHGIFQWHADRRAAILKSTGINVDTADHKQQLEAAFYEGTKGMRAGFLQSLNGRSLPDAVHQGVHRFEGSANQPKDTAIRLRMAQGWDGGGSFMEPKHGPTATAPIPAGASTKAITDAEVFAARQRIINGSTDPKDRALVDRYKAEQNTPKTATHGTTGTYVERGKPLPTTTSPDGFTTTDHRDPRFAPHALDAAHQKLADAMNAKAVPTYDHVARHFMKVMAHARALTHHDGDKPVRVLPVGNDGSPIAAHARAAAMASMVHMASADRYAVAHHSVTNSSDTRIGSINVHTAATDARGIAADIEPHLHRGQAAGRADYGLA